MDVLVYRSISFYHRPEVPNISRRKELVDAIPQWVCIWVNVLKDGPSKFFKGCFHKLYLVHSWTHFSFFSAFVLLYFKYFSIFYLSSVTLLDLYTWFFILLNLQHGSRKYFYGYFEERYLTIYSVKYLLYFKFLSSMWHEKFVGSVSYSLFYKTSRVWHFSPKLTF